MSVLRAIARHLLSASAAALLLVILVVPADATPATLLRLPIEGLVALALVVART